jgi:outer membrane receptor for ferrienterochelin and colicin
MIIRTVFVIGLGISLAACAGSGPREVRGERNVITAEEIAQSNHANAYDIVLRLRPQFLQQRGGISIRDADPVYPLVYVDGMQRGGINELRQVPGSIVQHIEFISPADATTRWGTGHAAGVIYVSTRRE